MRIELPSDNSGLTGRECPHPECERYFKIEFGTGLEGEGLACHCPYCGHTAGHDEFFTPDQIEYVQSVGIRGVADAYVGILKELEFEERPRGDFGIGMSLKVERGPRIPIRHYREKDLETEVTCTRCTLRYAVYGVFAYCPDCRHHNSGQILHKNLEVIDKMLVIARAQEAEVAEKLMENALEDCVSTFDGFGRELCRIHAEDTTNPPRVKKVRFQNLYTAQRELQTIGLELTHTVGREDWETAVKMFQKRHLIAHKMGVIDQEYIDRTQDSEAVRGRKIRVSAEEVTQLSQTLRTMAENITSQFEDVGKSANR